MAGTPRKRDDPERWRMRPEQLDRTTLADLRLARLRAERALRAALARTPAYRGTVAQSPEYRAWQLADRRYRAWAARLGHRSAAAPPPQWETGGGGRPPRTPASVFRKVVQHVKRLPPDRRADAFARWAARLERATKGAWSAKRLPLCSGGTCFVGDQGHALVFDPGGAIYRGHIGDRSQFVLGPKGVDAVYSALTPV